MRLPIANGWGKHPWRNSLKKPSRRALLSCNCARRNWILMPLYPLARNCRLWPNATAFPSSSMMRSMWPWHWMRTVYMWGRVICRREMSAAGSARGKSWVFLPIPSKRRWRPNGTGPIIWASVPSTVQQRSRMPIRYRSRRCSRSARR